ncbi:proton channel OTOP3-like [Chanos chanos]|uniref:Proton channel OTOP3-like n=1 Tax=Chanos chanos TaxID=29144 RepID=A0A6J2VD09_CHACN|nr:proton channel OTOP3-like [Chanos chanos]
MRSDSEVMEESTDMEIIHKTARAQNNVEEAHEEQGEDSVLLWVPSARRLVSGLVGLNVMLFGAALVAGEAFNPWGFRHQEPQVFLLVLMSLSLLWMLWYLLWARRQPGLSPHTDHHAGGITVTVVLMVFAGFSLLLHVFRMGYFVMMVECNSFAKVISPFIEAPFLGLQTYFLWAHSKDCIHKHKIITRSGLMLTLSADLLLWLNAVTEETLHLQIEMERENKESENRTSCSDLDNTTVCHCRAETLCLVFRKGYEILYPFNIEYCLMAGSMLYVMWKNVGRRVKPGAHSHEAQKITFRIVHSGGILLGPACGILVLLVGVAIFILYQVWVSQKTHRLTAFLLFYGYHLGVMPVMSLCSLAGMVVHKLEKHVSEDGHNPTRSLDVILLVGAALGQLSLSYFSLVAALSEGLGRTLGDLDLCYSVLTLLELILQNIFIIEGLHRHPSLHKARSKKMEPNFILKEVESKVEADGAGALGLLETGQVSPVPPSDQKENNTRWSKRAIQEICSFLILTNIMLWIIPAFGAHPQFENGLGKQFYGFTTWFVLVNLGQPLAVFYRMHSVGALMELLVTA